MPSFNLLSYEDADDNVPDKLEVDVDVVAEESNLNKSMVINRLEFMMKVYEENQYETCVSHKKVPILFEPPYMSNIVSINTEISDLEILHNLLNYSFHFTILVCKIKFHK